MAKWIDIVLFWFFLSAFLAVSFGFVSNKEQEVVCHEIRVFFADGTKSGFITQDDVLSVFEKMELNILGYPLRQLPLKTIEELVTSYSQVKQAEAYYDLRGVLHIEITQRKPVMRVAPQRGNDYYVDEQGVAMPLSDASTAHVLYVNGHLRHTLREGKVACLFEDEGSDCKDLAQMRDLYKLAKFLHDDTFWNAQFVQLYVDRDGQIELIPRVGAHIILMGTTDNYKRKLENLKTVYQKGFSNLGWNRYDRIDLRFANQVVCTRR